LKLYITSVKNNDSSLTIKVTFMCKITEAFNTECVKSYEAGLMCCSGPISEELAVQLVPKKHVPTLVRATKQYWEAGLENAPMPSIAFDVHCGDGV
jgi:hypothetical protein